jgi:ABC-type antimicrobial peptide transport system permease subunit
MYLLTECLLLGLAGGMPGLVIATGLIHAAVALAPSDLSMLRAAHLDARVLGFMVLVAAGSVIAFGLAPALSGTRSEGDNHVRVGV